MLSAGEIATMRDEVLRVGLPDDAALDAPTQSRTRTGGYTEVMAEVWAGKGRLSPMSVDDMEMASRIEARGTWVIALPVGVNVTTAMQCRIKGKTLQITGVLAPESFDVSQKVYASEVG